MTDAEREREIAGKAVWKNEHCEDIRWLLDQLAAVRRERDEARAELTTHDAARRLAIRDKFQTEKPTLEQLVASGEYTDPMPLGEYLERLPPTGNAPGGE